jgi:nucleoside-diphosphate-sugar epimerase|tara:strand:- start:1200 stop:1682 length:483 start_codon:yes stop_codon:yes gene_type:complete
LTDNSDKPVVIVTGSSGYIGSAIVKKLAARYRVIGFDRDAAPHPPAEAECVCVDVTDQASIDAAFERVRTAYGKRIASFVHLAAYFDLTGEPNPKYDAVTVKGTGRLLDALQDFEIDQFVFVSTMLAHAPIKGGGLIDETSPLDTDLPCPSSKHLAQLAA